MKFDPLAVHEASHAVVAHLLGGRLVRCAIKSGAGHTKWTGLSRLASLRAVVAGHQGERLLMPAEAHPDHAAEDIGTASRIALSIARLGEAAKLEARGLREPTPAMLARYEARAEKIIGHAEAEAARLLAGHREALVLVARRLHEDGTVTDETVAAIVARSTKGGA